MRFTAAGIADNLIIIRDEKRDIVAFVPLDSKYTKLLVAAPQLLEEARLSCAILAATGQNDSPRRKTLAAIVERAAPPREREAGDDGYFVLIDKGTGEPFK